MAGSRASMPASWNVCGLWRLTDKGRLRGFLYYCIAKPADLFYLYTDLVSGLHISRRFHFHSYAAAGAGTDDITRLEGEDRRQIADKVIAIEQQVPGVGRLAQLPVDPGADVQYMRALG